MSSGKSEARRQRKQAERQHQEQMALATEQLAQSKADLAQLRKESVASQKIFQQQISATSAQNQQLTQQLTAEQGRVADAIEAQNKRAEDEKKRLEKDKLTRLRSGNRRRMALIRTSEQGVTNGSLNVARRKVFGN